MSVMSESFSGFDISEKFVNEEFVMQSSHLCLSISILSSLVSCFQLPCLIGESQEPQEAQEAQALHFHL